MEIEESGVYSGDESTCLQRETENGSAGGEGPGVKENRPGGGAVVEEELKVKSPELNSPAATEEDNEPGVGFTPASSSLCFLPCRSANAKE